jgi:hypothetical protein
MFNLQNYLHGRNTEEFRMYSIAETDGRRVAVRFKQPAVQ